MKRAVLGFIAAFALLPLLGAAPTKPIAPRLWLVGGTWSADASGLGRGMLRIDTVYKRSTNGSFVRFTTAFVSTKGSVPTYDGNLYYDSATRQFALWYMNANAEIGQGPVAVGRDHEHVVRSQRSSG